jgi:hypothetical protein
LDSTGGRVIFVNGLGFQSVDAALAYCLSSGLEWTIDKAWR